MFGNNNQNQNTVPAGNLFGGSKPSAPDGGAPSLFGSNAPVTSGGSMFGKPNQATDKPIGGVATSSSLFGGAASSNAPSVLFG